ncbi:MAG: hypothetical protein DRN49_03320 [Thaumarchaeota archaeon]|nr:MAG: hypothetical protein DRN49_03320 [Nitrososphaerota archaeon]
MALRKFIMAILLVSLIASIPITFAEQDQESAVIKVVDPFGEPMKGVEVLLTKDGEVFRFLTNSTGYATFTKLMPGKYNVSVIFKDVKIFSGELDYPSQRELEAIVLLSRMNLTLTNLDGKPVKGVVVMISSSSKKFNMTTSSDVNGVASFKYIPYSSLPDIGEYSLKVFKGSVTYFEEQLNISKPSIQMNLTLPLITLKVTTTNLEGEPVPRTTITLSAKKFKESKRAVNGSAVFENIPSSKLEDVGRYRFNVTLWTGVGEIPVHFEERELLSSGQLYIVMDLAKLYVKILDEDNVPVKGVSVWLSNRLAENFTSATTDSRGIAEFDNVPLSGGKTNAGKYSVKVLKAGRIIGEEIIEVSEPRQELKIVVTRMKVRISLSDYEGKPLSGYLVSLTDMETGERFNATTEADGSISLKLFFGNYRIDVSKDEYSIYSGLVKISNSSLKLKVEDVNFPYMIIVKDGFGKQIESGSIKVKAGDEVIHESALTGQPIKLKLPRPTTLYIDVYADDGKLIERTKILARRPGRAEITLSDYIYLNGLIPLEVLGLMISIIALIIFLGVSGLLIYRYGIRRKS